MVAAATLPPAAPALAGGSDTADVLRRLAIVFTDFESRLAQTPLIRRLSRGRFTLEDYRGFLCGLRQQVKDGALWMSRAASNLGEARLELRSRLMRHAVAEHRDFRMLEADYVAAGGALAAIQGAEKNIGAEALSAWMFHQASQPEPVGLLGAMWIIEGLGRFKALEWGRLAQKRLDLPEAAVRFLVYHGENDADHIEEFEAMLRPVLPDPAAARRIVRTAEVTARLYVLQIEEMA
ncbi:iron-containing redox enzyme family protein [Caulobacter sp. KR2-114]|uniref:iron-containing redox enzyme family protein n=1 Tax=Caulobacter sp. KR2-114 TaxID=3400912 RepID=UPI003BFDEA7B